MDVKDLRSEDESKCESAAIENIALRLKEDFEADPERLANLSTLSSRAISQIKAILKRDQLILLQEDRGIYRCKRGA